MKRSRLCKGQGRAGSRQRAVCVKWFSTCLVKCCERLLGRHRHRALLGSPPRLSQWLPQAMSLSNDLGPGRYERREVSSPSSCCVVTAALLAVTCAQIWCQMIAFVHRLSCLFTVLTPFIERAIMVLYGRVPSLQARMPDDLRWSWCNNNRNKVHNKCNALESSPNHPPTQGHGKIVSHEIGPWCQKGWEPLH